MRSNCLSVFRNRLIIDSLATEGFEALILADLSKPPIAINVIDLKSFARLGLALTEDSPLIWHLVVNEGHILGILTAYMYWRGAIPIFANVRLERAPDPFLAYTSNGPKGEDVLFTKDMDDTRYRYAPLIDLTCAPNFLAESIKEKPKPSVGLVSTKLSGEESLARTLLFLSLDEPTFPLWCFRRGRNNILGTIVPFENYYECDALPVFFYVDRDNPPSGRFLKYSASKPRGEYVQYSEDTSDPKYFYLKIIDVEDMPFF